MLNILVVEKELSETGLNELKTIENVKYFDSTLSQEEKESIEVVLGTPKKELLEQLPNLKLVQLFSAGASHIDYLNDDIILANAYGAYGQGIGEFMLASTLSFQKDFLHIYQNQKEHEWKKDNKVFVMHKSTILSIGMGSIGTEYLRLCKLLGAKTIGIRRTVHDKPDFVDELYSMNDIDDLLAISDVVALSLPETKETINMFDEKRLRKMKKNAILINVGRGSAIVTNDLINVLKDGYFQGVCLDVTSPEPLPKNNPLWNFKNVQITPHISGGFNTEANYNNVMNIVKENIIRYRDHKELIHVVDKKLGY